MSGVCPAAARLREYVHRPLRFIAANGALGGAGRDRAAAHRDAVTELVVCEAVGGGQLGELGGACPAAGRLPEHVHSPLLQIDAHGVGGGAGSDRVPAYGNAVAKTVAFRAVGGRQAGGLGRVRPAAGRLREHVRRPLVGVAANRMEGRAGGDRVGADRDAQAELVACSAGGGRELGGFSGVRPAAGRLREYVHRPLRCIAANGALDGAGSDRPAVDRDAVAELVVGDAVGRGELGGLRSVSPAAGRLGEHIDRALLRFPANGPEGAGGDRLTAYRDAPAEIRELGAVGGRQLGGLGGVRPAAARLREHVHRALARIAANRVVRRTDGDRVTVDRDAGAELVVCGSVRRGQLGSLEEGVDPDWITGCPVGDADQQPSAGQLHVGRQPAAARVGHDQAAIDERTERHRLSVLDRRTGQRSGQSDREPQLAVAGGAVSQREPLLETQRAIRVPLRQSRSPIHGPVRSQDARVDLAESLRGLAPAHRL